MRYQTFIDPKRFVGDASLEHLERSSNGSFISSVSTNETRVYQVQVQRKRPVWMKTICHKLCLL